MSQKLSSAIAVIGIDIGKNSFHIVGHDHRGAIVLRQKWSRGQVETRLANLPPCLIARKNSGGAYRVRFTPRSGRLADMPGRPLGANCGSFHFIDAKKDASRGLNKNIPAILNRIESAHTLNKGRSWYPHPASARRVDVKDKERVGFSVVCAKRRDMSGALLAYSLALVVDDHIVPLRLRFSTKSVRISCSGLLSSTMTSRVVRPFALSISSS